MWRVKADATPFLRVRCKPNGDIIGKFAPAKTLNVQSIEGGWARVKIDDDVNVWVSAAYIEDGLIQPPPFPTVDYRKIGLHLHTGGNADACVRVYDDCARAGKPIPVAVVINNTGLVDTIKQVSRETFVLYRGGINTQTGTDVLPLVPDDNIANSLAGERRFNERYAVCSADAYQIANEHYDKGHPAWKVEAMSQFYLGAMAAAEARKKIISVGDFSTGTPEDDHLEVLAPMLRHAEEKGHILNYHGYAPPDVYDMTSQAEWFSMRWERIQRNYPKLRVIIGETGGYHRNSDNIMAMMRQYHAMLATNKAVIGAAVYTANAAQDWIDKGFGFDPYLNEYATWFKSL